MNQRLFEITLLLTGGSGVTAGSLAERFGVSKRTIYRDIDALSLAGVPVYSERGRGGGLRLLPGYVLDKTLFTREERAQLTAHLGSLAALGAPDTRPLQEKLAALFGPADDWLEVDFAPWGGGEETREVFRLLRGAIIQRQVLRLWYAPAPGAGAGEGSGQPREVEPCRVVFRGQGWYLHAWCRLRGGWRFFKLNRIRKAEPAGERFTAGRPRPGASAPYTGPKVRLCLRLAPSAEARVMDEFGEARRLPGGGFLVEGDFPDGGGWLVGYILSFGAAATVQKPAWLRREVARQAAEIQANNAGDTVEDNAGEE